MLFRFFRYVKLFYGQGRKGIRTTPALVEYYWLLAYFTAPRDRSYIRQVMRVLNNVSKVVVSKREPKLKTWERLWRFKPYDAKYFLGVDLINSPTRSILCLLKHYGDINEYELLKYWDWASAKDAVRSNEKYPTQYEFELTVMQTVVEQTALWAKKRNEQCQQHNTIVLPMDYQQV